jgi:hypothetical protein
MAKTCRGACRAADLAVDVLDLAADRPWRDDQRIGDRLVREAAREQHEDLDIAVRQAGRLRAPAPDAVPCRAEHRLDRIRIQPPARDLEPQLLGGIVGRTRRARGLGPVIAW